MGDATDARQRTGGSVWVCGSEAGEVEAWRKEGEGANTCGHRRKLLINETLCLVLSFLLLFLCALASTVAAVEGAVSFGCLLADVISVLGVFCIARTRSCPEAGYAVV